MHKDHFKFTVITKNISKIKAQNAIAGMLNFYKLKPQQKQNGIKCASKITDWNENEKNTKTYRKTKKDMIQTKTIS